MKVSAVITAYNHEPFIREAIEGFLMQKTDFPCELIIADDCSTDGTRDVIRPYWERHPDRIRVLLNRRNIGARRTFVRAYGRCRGQYVATLDGDDCWTSAHKLQRQADLLDRRPDLALCFHSVGLLWDDGSRAPALCCPDDIRETYTLDDLLRGNFITSCSPLYRKGVFGSFPPWYFVMPIGDWSLLVLHAQHGAIGYIDEPMGMYRQHPAGMYSMKPSTHRQRVAIEMLRRFRYALGRRHARTINRSLARHYCGLIRQYADEGNPRAARRCLRECCREIRLGAGLPVRKLLRTAFYVHAPGLFRSCRWVARVLGRPLRAGR